MGRERMGSSLPPASQARRDSALFEKMKCIFSIAPMGNLEKLWECFLHRTLAQRHRTLGLRVRCAVVLGSARAKHRTVSTGSRVAPVHVSGAI